MHICSYTNFNLVILQHSCLARAWADEAPEKDVDFEVERRFGHWNGSALPVTFQQVASRVISLHLHVISSCMMFSMIGDFSWTRFGDLRYNSWDVMNYQIIISSVLFDAVTAEKEMCGNLPVPIKKKAARPWQSQVPTWGGWFKKGQDGKQWQKTSHHL